MLTLVIGNKNYSSWSMRAWLLLKLAGVEFREQMVLLYRDGSRAEVRALGGETGLAPVLLDDNCAVWDTLAILEYLYESSPQLWPRDKNLRAYGRSVAAEIHSGLNALRAAMSMNIRGRGRAEVTAAVQSDIDRVLQIWEHCLGTHGGPWLLGEYCALDIMFAPVATRFQSYGVVPQGRTARYAVALLAQPHVADWIAAGTVEPHRIEMLEKALKH